MGAVMLGATASTLSLFTNSMHASLPSYDEKKWMRQTNGSQKLKDHIVLSMMALSLMPAFQ
tara:strand:+ start:27939 stop:28121 length:183 start_codon:yes stop_codon:yes gene_type:complete